jgi:hypothetical protein
MYVKLYMDKNGTYISFLTNTLIYIFYSTKLNIPIQLTKSYKLHMVIFVLLFLYHYQK